MSKVSADYLLKEASQSLSQKDFSSVYTYAGGALALGATQAAYYLCAYYYHQMQQEKTSEGRIAKGIDFGIMYQLSAYFKLKGYTEFTYMYNAIFSKIHRETKEAVVGLVAGYKHYLAQLKGKYSLETEVDIDTVEALASSMYQLTTKFCKDYKVTGQELMYLKEGGGNSNGDSHVSSQKVYTNGDSHNDHKIPLLGGQHNGEHHPDKDCCTIL